MERGEEIRIEIADETQLGSFCDLQNQVWPDHPSSLDEILRDRRILPEEQLPTVWIAWKDSQPLGYSMAYRYVGEYHPQKWNVMVGIPAANRRAGLGSTLYDAANQFIEQQVPMSIATRVSDQDPTSYGFASRRGFVEHKRDFESELQLAAFDPDLHRPSIEPSVRIEPGIEFDSPEKRREFHELFEELRVDVPRAEPPVRLSFERFQELVLDDPYFSWDVTRIATVDGKMIGFSGMFATAQDGLLEQWLTATHRSFRGRKIALALKVAATQRAKDLGYQRIRTNNDTRNAAMLAINDRLGYRRLPGMITMIKRLDA